MLKMLYASCPGPSPAISAQFTLKMCITAKNRKKKNSLKTPILGIQGHLRSWTLTTIKSLSLLHVYDKHHACAYLQPFSRYTR